MADSTSEQPEFLTVSQIAKRLQMSPQTVRTWIEEGMLRGIRVRKVWRVPREDFEQLLASLDSGPVAPAVPLPPAVPALTGPFWVAAATLFSLWPGLFTSTWNGDKAGLSRFNFELATLLTMAALLVLAVIFWAVGRGHAIHTGPLTMAAQAAPAAAGD